MPEAIGSVNAPGAQQKLDRHLLLSLMLSPVAAGINTIVGFIVAHWIATVAYKKTGYLVAMVSFTFCAAAAGLAWSARTGLTAADDTLPQDGRRVFMANLALLLAALCAVVVLAGTLVLVTLRPND